MKQLTDPSKLSMITTLDAFKNNGFISGDFTISGTTAPGTNIITATETLPFNPDMPDVVFNGASDTAWEGTFGDQDPRPDDGWFKQGAVWVRGDDAGAGYTDEPTIWQIYGSINDDVLTITAVYVQTFIADLALTAAPVKYRVIDYSVF